MATTSQKILSQIFSNLHSLLSLVGCASFKMSTPIARFYSDKEFKQNPKIKTKNNRYIHWHVFKLKKNEESLSFYSMKNSQPEKMMAIGKKYIEGKRANAKLLGYLHGSTSQINAICSQSTPPLTNFSPKFWPIPHWSHLELCNAEIIEGMEQLRCQVLAKKMTKYHELDGKSFSTELF